MLLWDPKSRMFKQRTLLRRSQPDISIFKGRDFSTPKSARKLIDDVFRISDTNVEGIDGSKEIFIEIPSDQQNIYGHWLIDIIPAYLYARAKTQHQTCMLINGEVPEFLADTLALFGLDLSVVKKSETLPLNGASNSLEVSPFRAFDFYNIKRYSTAIEPFHFNYSKNTSFKHRPQGRFYFSRSKWKAQTVDSRSLINFKYVEDFFQKLGFEVIYPEAYTPLELLEYVSTASIIAGEAGSAMHNSLFVPPEVKFINLQSFRQEHLIQSALCKIKRQQIAYVWGENETNDWSSNFSIDEASLKLIAKSNFLDS